MNAHYNTIENQILSGDYVLGEMIDTIYFLLERGKINKEELDKLIDLAREHADPSVSLDYMKALDGLEKRVGVLEGKVKALEDGKVEPTPEPEPDPGEPNANAEFPAYDNTRGYRAGDKCTCNGKHWACTPPDYVDVVRFSPVEYPAYWTEQN